ncbi:4-alpha-glucanotransferase [Tessaracoccus sp. MC1865]|uniref:4-alpha-glucanotransferase n=1 Tax=Tessaracoccus sp. MC1865 TaxID=2760310 RepID=UPI00160141D9|nr:4-alpha-glucanotransferase [Tessaracoccus sp. MC1865]MBB1484495.1 4-alpha-glucanotransferase [Tessaracoccus sp. MC1865]QTO38404.1 4-alpha-glucanotransferase [Tessaracoccus sp. MC1865]
MSDVYPGLAQLAEKFGIAQEFWDWKGRHQAIPAETIIEVLRAFEIDASTPQAADDALTRLEDDRWRRTLPACTVAEEGQGIHVDVHVPAGTSVEISVRLESGETRTTWQSENARPDRWVDGAPIGEATFWLGDDLPIGYHEIVAHTVAGKHRSSLIITPSFVGFPTRMRGDRIWGYGTQLYSVTSSRSWGIGDLGDLADLITWSGTRQFAGYVLINPLHAAEPAPPIEPSPYLPASRRFINPIYIHPESIPEYATLGKDERKRIKLLLEQAQEAADTSGIVDRNAIWPLKLEALRIIHGAGMRPARHIAFQDFRGREGIGLRFFALWSALSIEFGQFWAEWPEAYRSPSSPAVAAFAEANAEEVDFFEWLQWVAQTQVSAAQTVADEVGMPVGIVTDLAVGVHRYGAETWMMPDVFAQGMSVGAPPDQYNQSGQDWGQPPWRPDRLEELAYEPFRAMVAAALRRVGGLRVDHIIGMFRLWWVPQGLGPTAGTYVRNNHEAMIGILALEAQRAQALVVGEDLGTVEPWVRDYLSRRGLLGTSVLWFESGLQGEPLDAQWWREYCMASVTTHDLPPTLGYLAGDHVRLRHDLGLLTEPLETELAAAQQEQADWVTKLIVDGLLDPAHRDDPVEVMLALHQFLLRTPSKVLLAALADAVGERRAQNQPGTINEYPNWRVPLGDATGHRLDLAEIFQAELPRRLAAVMNGVDSQPESRWG